MSKRSPCRSPAIATNASPLIAGGSAAATTAPSSTSYSTACDAAFRGGSAASAEAVAQVGTEVVADHRVLQRQIDDSGQPSQRCPGVVPAGVAEHSMKGTGGSLDPQRIGQLDLATGTRLHALDLLEDVGRQDVSADDDQIAGSVVDRRLLDHRAHADDTVAVELPGRVDDAVGTDLITWHPLQPDDTSACGLTQASHLVE